MTSEIAIMNKEGIALAADSAVTMESPSGEKIFTSANKLFALSKYHPVGIMVYGNALFMDIPWEIIIKIYRKELGIKKFDTLEEYANNFVQYLSKTDAMFLKETEEIFFERTVRLYLMVLKENIYNRVNEILTKEDSISDEQVIEISSDIVNSQYELWKSGEFSPNVDESFVEDIIKKYKNKINKEIKAILMSGDLRLKPASKKKLIEIIGLLFSKFPEGIRNPDRCGVVIAGFGEKEIFPSLIPYQMEGILDGKLKYLPEGKISVSFQTDAVIRPFAQEEMVHTFMQGVDPKYIEVERDFLSSVFSEYSNIVLNQLKKKDREELSKKFIKINETILNDFDRKMAEYRKDKYVRTIMNVVSMLPKDELAAMAESLINLTSLKRRWSMEMETVGGPIDVALISKSDGFIWIKRKHYFKPELNPQFFENYFKEV